jgi:Uncharacterized conserved protein
MDGIYLAAFRLQEDAQIPISTLDNPELRPGLYVYVGSGQNGVEHRIRRHFSEVENTHWHIDHLSAEAEPVGAVALELPGVYECMIARAADGEAVEGFGCSDCRCDSHLFKLAEET